jgi:hypothetical protein
MPTDSPSRGALVENSHPGVQELEPTFTFITSCWCRAYLDFELLKIIEVFCNVRVRGRHISNQNLNSKCSSNIAAALFF